MSTSHSKNSQNFSGSSFIICYLVHFADSNRQAMGLGHTDPAPIIAALKQVGYTGYLSAEVFPTPDADACAAQEIQAIKEALA